jgi:DNA topoisomerase IB
MPRERALGTAFRLLDLGFFRVGGEAYAEDNGSYGLATIQKRHVRVRGNEVIFEYTAKSAQQRLVAVADEAVRDAVSTLRDRRGGGPELLAYRDARRWRDVSSNDINQYVKDVVGGDVTAKDFRTWHGTVLAAVALAGAADIATSKTRTTRRRRSRQASRHDRARRAAAAAGLNLGSRRRH